MRRSVALAIVFGFSLSFGTTIAAMAHEGDGEAKVEVEPPGATAGETVILAGSGLEADTDRVLVLVGGTLTIDLGTVQTDAEGTFSAELALPDFLPAGSYELQAIGDETLSTTLQVTAAEGTVEVSPGANDVRETVVPRDRTPMDVGVMLALVVILAGVGVLLVWHAERLGSATAT